MEHSDYYVYTHKRKDSGVVFYVGSGRRKRAYSRSKTKTAEWSKVEVEAGGHEVEILHTGLSKDESLNIEAEYIINPPEGWCLVNKKLPSKVNEITFEFANEYWAYDENSKTGLVWKKSMYKSRVGTVAGTMLKSDKCYWTVIKNGKGYLIHRLIAVLHGYNIEGKVIDHLDGNGLNNKIENLKVTSQVENSIAKRATKRSTTGHTGLSLSERNGRKFYHVQLMFNGKIYQKRFYIEEENALERAIEWRQNILQESLGSLGG